MQHFPPPTCWSPLRLPSARYTSQRFIASISRLGTETLRGFFSLFSFRWLEKRDSWSSGPDSTSQTVSCPNKQSLKAAQTSMVRSSCGLNTRPRCKTHTGFMIIIETSAAVCSSLLHSSGEWTTYSWQPPGSRQHPPLPVWTVCRCVQKQFMSCLQTKRKKGVFRHPSLSHTHSCTSPSLRGHNKHIRLSANTTAVKLSPVRQNLLNGPTFQKWPF